MATERVAPTHQRHCERSEAIHSFFARRDGLLRFARNDAVKCVSAFSRRVAPEVCVMLRLFENRGRREDRVRAAPAVSCAMCTKECAHEHTGSAESIRPSLRNGFTAYNALSPATGFVATVTSRSLRKLDASTGASGPHAFAVRLSRARQSQLLRPSRPTARS